MVFVSEIETESRERTDESRRAVKEKGLLNLLLFTELAQDQHDEMRCSGLKQP